MNCTPIPPRVPSYNFRFPLLGPCVPRWRPYRSDAIENCRSPGGRCSAPTPPEFACASLPIRCDHPLCVLGRCRWDVP